jgi:hypothetical protein
MPHHHEAFEHHEHSEHAGHAGGDATCRLCSQRYTHAHNPSRLGICEKCGYKILMVLIVLMVISSYAAWFGVF